MKREKAEAFINAIIAMRESATDEQAAAAAAIYPEWKETGVYKTGDRVVYDGVLYKTLQDHNAQAGWQPAAAASLFAKVLIPDDTTIYEWEKPESTNPYMKGDKVKFNGVIYVSTIDNNSWSPAEYPQGWEEVNA